MNPKEFFEDIKPVEKHLLTWKQNQTIPNVEVLSQLGEVFHKWVDPKKVLKNDCGACLRNWLRQLIGEYDRQTKKLEAMPKPVKKKRTRRTKAQIEADKKAAEAKKQSNERK
jgi:hypothetical protein